MADADRIPCLNPRCRRTAPREKYGRWAEEIICGKCWRALPPAMRDRNRQLERRDRRLKRMVSRRLAAGTLERAAAAEIGNELTQALDENWSAIRKYYLEPKVPVGLEGFLAEIGLQ
jgi:hypothetical protein